MSYAHHVEEHRRLVLLRLLSETPGYSSNSSILQGALEQYGIRSTRDQVHTQLHWLVEQGLVKVETVASVLRVELTARGLDVAEGKARVPGVKRPGPGD